MLRISELLEEVEALHPGANLDLIQKAYLFAAKVHGGAAESSQDPTLQHSLAVARILAELNLDEVTLACGLLHDVVEEAVSDPEQVRSHFGDEVASVLQGLARVSAVRYTSRKKEQAERFRRLILAMAQDVRVVLVKLADRLQVMRTLEARPPPERLVLAQETLDIYAPLANRLGIHRIKSELEDLGFRYAHPETWAELEEGVRRRLAEREAYIEEVKDRLARLLERHELPGRVSGRPKHLFSIHRKMQDQGIPLDKVYDLVAFRIITRTVQDCYAILGAIHAEWKPVPGRFKDYIALPKPNLYQSLHTTVIGPGGQPMEVQIRTEEMHRIAEEGIAAHWRYKEKRSEADPMDRVFEWLRKLVEAHKEIQDPQEFLESVKGDWFPEVVYVFTPAGDLIELPRGATPVDFAYAIHSKVGEQCVGAKVNGRMVPLSHELRNGDRVEVITSKHHTPSPDWLEFVKTSKARNKIRAWIKARQRARSTELGREICEREFRKFDKSLSKALKSGEMERAAKGFGLNKAEELLEAVGYGKISARQVLGKIYPDLEEREAPPKRPRKPPRTTSGIVIEGVGDALVRFARCCHPLPGDPIVGFVTRGQGMTVHTADCPNVRRLDPARRVPVEWGSGKGAVHPVKIRVDCEDRRGILAEITNLLAEHDVNVARAQVSTWAAGQAVCRFEILVEDLERLQKVLSSILSIKGVQRVTRVKT
ncbi:RelA/SpoT family protein [Deferrisoma camini]|uniref:RelA/SpoT family protein n=1 Tax=Deferrisoma camini TaxID=1035120 RepID=UPI00046CF140|nr:bifunctional (p)ppGpp synthetase/guanosine-3',5'-bis(diphosphate) 3'-pyrophosphohydrolase [Deferrisoma camini]